MTKQRRGSNMSLVRGLTIVLAASSAALAFAGGTAAAGSSYVRGDLPGIVDPKPAVPNWSFTEGHTYLLPTPVHAPAFTLSEFIGQSPTSGDRVFADKLARAGFVIGRHRVWNGQGPRLPAKAVVFAFLFRTAPGAATGIRVIKPPGAGTRVEGLGDEAWKLDSHRGAVFLWRRGNLVVYAGADCGLDCGFSAAVPARAYAAELDARARRVA